MTNSENIESHKDLEPGADTVDQRSETQLEYQKRISAAEALEEGATGSNPVKALKMLIARAARSIGNRFLS